MVSRNFFCIFFIITFFKCLNQSKISSKLKSLFHEKKYQLKKKLDLNLGYSRNPRKG